jgi:hypothetical protein
MFRKNLLPLSSSTMMMEAAGCSETLVPVDKSTRWTHPWTPYLDTDCHETPQISNLFSGPYLLSCVHTCIRSAYLYQDLYHDRPVKTEFCIKRVYKKWYNDRIGAVPTTSKGRYVIQIRTVWTGAFPRPSLCIIATCAAQPQSPPQPSLRTIPIHTFLPTSFSSQSTFFWGASCDLKKNGFGVVQGKSSKVEKLFSTKDRFVGPKGSAPF